MHATRLCILGVILALGPALAAGAADESAPAPKPSAEQIAAWIKQLGSEAFAVRRDAMEKLKTAGEAAIEPLETAAQSAEDLEIRTNAKLVLPFARAATACRYWKRAMRTQWTAGLKEARITGPSLGHAPGLGQGGKGENPKKADDNRCRSSVDDSLGWYQRNQEADGHWDALAHGADYHADVEQTALGLLANLGAGHTEKIGRHKEAVRKAVAWLIERQRADGAIVNDGWDEPDGLAHAVAGLALAEAAGMARMPGTVAAAQKAVDYSLKHQTRTAEARSGFGRLAKSDSPDLFTSAFFTMHLKSAKVAGLRVDPMAFDGLIRFLDTVDAKNPKEGGFFSFVPGGKASPEATLMGCLARQFMGTRREDLAAQIEAAAKAFAGPTAGLDDSDPITNYFGTLAIFNQGGDVWKTWNEKMKKSLLKAQHEGGDAAGSWDPKGKWSGAGRVFATTVNSLCLEIYYRYLPIYKE